MKFDCLVKMCLICIFMTFLFVLLLFLFGTLNIFPCLLKCLNRIKYIQFRPTLFSLLMQALIKKQFKPQAKSSTDKTEYPNAYSSTITLPTFLPGYNPQFIVHCYIKSQRYYFDYYMDYLWAVSKCAAVLHVKSTSVQKSEGKILCGWTETNSLCVTITFFRQDGGVLLCLQNKSDQEHCQTTRSSVNVSL